MKYELDLNYEMFGEQSFLNCSLNKYQKILLYVVKEFRTSNTQNTDIIVKKGSIIKILHKNFSENPSELNLYIGKQGETIHDYSDDFYFTYSSDSYDDLYFTKEQLNAFTVPFSYEKHFTSYTWTPTIGQRNFIMIHKFDIVFKNKIPLIIYFDKIYCSLINMFFFCEDVVINSFMHGILDTLLNLKNIESKCSEKDFEKAIDSTSIFLKKTLETMLEIGEKQPCNICTPKELLDNKNKKIEQEKLSFSNNSRQLTEDFITQIENRKELLEAFNKTTNLKKSC